MKGGEEKEGGEEEGGREGGRGREERGREGVSNTSQKTGTVRREGGRKKIETQILLGHDLILTQSWQLLEAISVSRSSLPPK